jgi:hypothetical protein
MTSGCGGSHLRVYDVISCERRDKMACNHDIREWVKIPGNRSFRLFHLTSLSIFISFVEQYLLHIPYSVPHTLSLMIYLLTAHRSNDKYGKMRLDSLSRTSCTHAGNVTHNITRNVIDVASQSHCKDKLRHATNRASVARAATSMTLSTSRRDVVWPLTHDMHDVVSDVGCGLGRIMLIKQWAFPMTSNGGHHAAMSFGSKQSHLLRANWLYSI